MISAPSLGSILNFIIIYTEVLHLSLLVKYSSINLSQYVEITNKYILPTSMIKRPFKKLFEFIK